MDPWKTQTARRKYSLLKLKMNFKKIVLVLRCYFFWSRSLLRLAFRSKCICLHKVNSFHVAPLNSLHIESSHLVLSLCDSFPNISTRVRIDFGVLSSNLWVKSLLLHIRGWLFWPSGFLFFTLASVQLEPSCSMRTDGQADMTKLIVAFRNFANAPVKSWCALVHYRP